MVSGPEPVLDVVMEEVISTTADHPVRVVAAVAVSQSRYGLFEKFFLPDSGGASFAGEDPVNISGSWGSA